MKLFDWIAEAEQKLNSRLEAELLAGYVLTLSRDELYSFDDALFIFPVQSANELVERRLNGEPVAYLRRQKEFYGRKFEVNSYVLIPRPETETLIEAVLPHLRPGMRCLDVGTGSGCIAITLCLEFPNCYWEAMDISSNAIIVATENVARLGANVDLLGGIGFENYTKNSYDLIVSNPPYVNFGDPALDPNVAKWEPEIALYSPNGIAFIEMLIDKSTTMLNEGGMLAFEFGYDQESQVRALLSNWQNVDIVNDLAGIPRVAIAWKPCS